MFLSLTSLSMCCHDAICYSTRRSYLTWLVLHRGKNMQCYAVCCTVFTTPTTSMTVLSSICFIPKPCCNIDIIREIFPALFLRFHLYDTCSFKSSLLRDKESETERWGWWKGCGGGGLTREERMTATIIKNVLLLRYLEASLPPQLLLSNNSLVTSLHCQTPRLLTRLWHWQKAKKRKKEQDCVLWTIQFDSFNLAEFNSSVPFFFVLIFYSGALIIQFNSIPFSHSVFFFLFVCQSTVI